MEPLLNLHIQVRVDYSEKEGARRESLLCLSVIREQLLYNT